MGTVLVLYEVLWRVKDLGVEQLVLPAFKSIRHIVVAVAMVQTPVKGKVLSEVGLSLKLEDLHLEEGQRRCLTVLNVDITAVD